MPARATWASTSCTSTRTRRSRRRTAGEGRAPAPWAWPSALRRLPARARSSARDDDGAFRWDRDRPQSIGRLHGFHGNVGVLVRAYAYVFLHGADGLKEVSELAALNANYLAALLVADDFPLAYPDGRPCTSSSRPPQPLKEETGIRAMDVAKRLIDLGYHPSTVYFPLVVDEAMMVEPTETETKETLDGFAAAFRQAADEARTDPDLLHEAPVTTPVRRLDEARAARQLKLTWAAEPPD